MRQAMLVSVAVYAAALVVLLPAFGNHGLWAALMVLYIVRALTLAWRYPGVEEALRVTSTQGQGQVRPTGPMQ
jgi:MATE family multidrug resistance protein